MSDKPSSNGRSFSDEELKEFLANRRVVVADPLKTSGRSLRKFVLQQGAKSENVVHCETFEEAKQAIESSPCHVLFVDIRLGVELVGLQRKAFQVSTDYATVVLTPDPSALEMGEIGEANVDAVLVKPFHFQGYLDAFQQAISEKIKPSPYRVQIEKGKGLLHAGSYDEALLVFSMARDLDPVPTLAFYYLGLIEEMRGQMEKAIEYFEKGLTLDSKDYRCLTGLFDLRYKASQFAEAYELAKRIHQDFPISPDRVLDLVKLSVQMKQFKDVIDYCRIFESLEKRDLFLSRVVVAGMLVCAKYLDLKKERARCLEVLKNAAKISLDEKVLCVDVLRYFFETTHYSEGAEFYTQLPDDLKMKREAQTLYQSLLQGRA